MVSLHSSHVKSSSKILGNRSRCQCSKRQLQVLCFFSVFLLDHHIYSGALKSNAIYIMRYFILCFTTALPYCFFDGCQTGGRRTCRMMYMVPPYSSLHTAKVSPVYTHWHTVRHLGRSSFVSVPNVKKKKSPSQNRHLQLNCDSHLAVDRDI